MKTRAILFLSILITGSSYILSQVTNDTLMEDNIYPQFNEYFSVEESWQIHKEAYKKKLEAMGLSENEITKKMLDYDNQKDELIEKIKEQRKLAEKERQLAEIQRKKAEEQRKFAEIQRKKAEEQRKLAENQREQIEAQRVVAMEQQKLAAEQREAAALQREVAEEQRKLAEEWRNSVMNLYDADLAISDNDSKSKSIHIEITEKHTLFFNINGSINSGNVLIEIFNPSGKKEGELSLQHRKESVQKTETSILNNTSGSINKTINASEIGDWIVKITPIKSNGDIHISVAQYVRPTIDE